MGIPFAILFLVLQGVFPAFCLHVLYRRSKKSNGVRFSLRTLIFASILASGLIGIPVTIAARSGAPGEEALWPLSMYVPLTLWGLCGILFRSVRRHSQMISPGDIVVGLFYGLIPWVGVNIVFLFVAAAFGVVGK